MEPGTIVEFIDRKKVVCGVVLQTKKNKVRLLTENDREVSLAENRIFGANGRVAPEIGRDRLAALLAEISKNRETLKEQVDVRELWEALNTESEWIDAETMASFAFPDPPDSDHISAVTRAFFSDRLYFRFDTDRFFPNSEDQVEELVTKARKERERKDLIERGGAWLTEARKTSRPSVPSGMGRVIDILKDVFLKEKESPHWEVGRQILMKAGVDVKSGLLGILKRIGVFDDHENVELLRLGIPVEFSEESEGQAADLARAPGMHTEPAERRDLTGLSVMTIDGQATADYDDAISIQEDADGYRLGIHISDVAHFIGRGLPLDAEAAVRASSIYMPDQKIPMLPPPLAEGLLSLRADEVRPAVSVMVRLTRDAEIRDWEVFLSLIRVRRQLTYHEVNLMAGADKEIIALAEIANRLREERMDAGALIISLPEINVWLEDDRAVTIHKINRESVSRMLVSEIMILGNRLMAEFLAKNHCPAVFRAQPEPRVRLFQRDEGTLYQNWMQRRHLSRFVLLPSPEPHAGLGVPAYVTATSPIRKYFDLVTQRQVRGVLGVEKPYARKEIEEIITATRVPLSKVTRLQIWRQRYWVFRYLACHGHEPQEAMVLERRRDRYVILLIDTMVEATLASAGIPALSNEQSILVRIEQVDPVAQTLKLALV